MQYEPLKVAVVGVGALGRHHARILSQLPMAELVAVADPNAALGQKVAEDCGCEWTPDYRTLLSQVEAVSLVVPTSLHRTVAEAFLCRSIPVLVEKPLTSNVDDGQVLVRLAAEHGVALQVGHIERFNPAFQALAERAGSPKYMRAERVSPYAFRSMDIGVVHDLMIHDIELALSLTGEMPERVEAFGVSILGGHEDCVQARLIFPGGCIADIVANRVAPSALRSWQCWSERGCLQADLHTRRVVSFTPGSPLRAGELPYDLVLDGRHTAQELKPQVFGRFIESEQFEGDTTDALTAELQSFLECVRERTAPRVSGTQGLAALNVAARVLQAVKTHAWDGTPEGRIGPAALIDHYLPTALPTRHVA